MKSSNIKFSCEGRWNTDFSKKKKKKKKIATNTKKGFMGEQEAPALFNTLVMTYHLWLTVEQKVQMMSSNRAFFKGQSKVRACICAFVCAHVGRIDRWDPLMYPPTALASLL